VRDKIKKLKVGSTVHSEDRVLTGQVVAIVEDLYGIKVKGIDGHFWRDRDALASLEKESH
jgi:hypothetical protein